jgi:hypothetical protein
MNVKSFLLMNYDYFAALRLRKNKANSNPNKAKHRLWPEARSTKP